MKKTLINVAVFLLYVALIVLAAGPAILIVANLFSWLLTGATLTVMTEMQISVAIVWSFSWFVFFLLRW